jgi:hypothetical protein
MGWAYSSISKEKLLVQALLSHVVIGEAVAELHRADLAAVGFGDGNCGYSIVFYYQIDPQYLPFVVVTIDGGDMVLPRSTISGYADFFHTLYAQYPVTGRHRSVFGGLWTDRVDAAALLRGRTDVGMVSVDVAGTLASFLQSGFAVLEDVFLQVGEFGASSGSGRGKGGGGKSSSAKSPAMKEIAGAVLQLEPVMNLLHQILEGPPLALSAKVVEGSDDAFHQPSTLEALPSPAECLSLVLPLSEGPMELEVVRDSHLFPEFTAEGRSRWVNRTPAASTDFAVRQHGMIDRFAVQPGSVIIVSPGLIHRVQTEPGTPCVRVLCTPSRHAPLDRMPEGASKEVVLEMGARIWIEG